MRLRVVHLRLEGGDPVLLLVFDDDERGCVFDCEADRDDDDMLIVPRVWCTVVVVGLLLFLAMDVVKVKQQNYWIEIQ